VRRNSFVDFGGAGIFDIIPFPLVPWRNSGRKRLCRRSGFRDILFFFGSRRSSRFCGFICKGGSIWVIIGDNSPFFDLSTFRKGRK
jgi:hypothetical protein